MRPRRKLTDIVPIAMIWASSIMVVATLIQMLVEKIGHEYIPNVASTDPAISFAGKHLSFIYIWPVTALFILIPPANRRMLRDILPNGRGNVPLGILLGLLGGFGINAACILASVLLGDVGLEFSTFNLLSLLLLFASVTVQSGAEEIVTRLYLYEKLRRRYRSPWVAIILNASLFGALHMANPGAGPLPIAQCVLIWGRRLRQVQGPPNAGPLGRGGARRRARLPVSSTFGRSRLEERCLRGCPGRTLSLGSPSEGFCLKDKDAAR